MAQILVWAKPGDGEFSPGDIVDVLPDGVHAGNAVLNLGQPWDGSVRSDSDFIILDVPIGATTRQAIREFVQRATGNAVPDLQTLNRFVRIDWQRLPSTVRNQLVSVRRRATTMSEMRPFIRLREGVTLQDVKDFYNGTRGPGVDPI